MKRFFIIFFLAATILSVRAAELFPFGEVNNKLNLSLNAGYHFNSNVGVMGFGVTIKGIHLTIGGVGNCKMKTEDVLKNKNTASAMIQLGYQIPIVKQFRVIPVVGTAAVGKVVFDNTDADKRSASDDPKTRLQMKYRFDAGVHFVYNYKKLIVNAAITRYTVFGGVGVEF